MRKFIHLLSEIVLFSIGSILFLFLYDKKYRKSIYFKSRFFGIGAKGWKWVISDFNERLLFGNNKGVPFPISPRAKILNPNNVSFHIDDLNNFQSPGIYLQAKGKGKITIGKGTWIAPNVGIITTNHKIGDLKNDDEAKDVIIGDLCWIGMNSIILPGVTLGSNTIVGAGAVVTKSFIEGNCVIVGNPAKIIKFLIISKNN